MNDLEFRTHKRYGWKPQLPDFRDHPADVSGLTVLEEVDPRAEMPAPYDQGQLGSCTGNAIAGAVEYDAILNGHDFVPSRLFIYYGEREIEGTVDSDSGAFGRDGLKVASNVGVCTETTWPYDIGKFTLKPSDLAYAEAARQKIGQYVAVPQDVSAIKAVLSNKQTIPFGFTVFESFEAAWSEPGKMPVPQAGEKMLGGHEVLLVGYLKDAPDCALVRNSWGAGWGLGGYFLMPWQFLLDPQMASDFWTIVRPL